MSQHSLSSTSFKICINNWIIRDQFTLRSKHHLTYDQESCDICYLCNSALLLPGWRWWRWWLWCWNWVDHKILTHKNLIVLGRKLDAGLREFPQSIRVHSQLSTVNKSLWWISSTLIDDYFRILALTHFNDFF